MNVSHIFRVVLVSAAIATSSSSLSSAAENELVLAIQPILSEQKTKAAFQPLADYLSKATGRKTVLLTRPNFLAYWDSIRRGTGYDLVFDAAHFTDYRAAKLKFDVLAKIPDSVTYSLIVSSDNLIFEPSELIGRRIATLGTPSIGAARLNALYPNPSRQPIVVEVDSAEDGLALLLQRRVEAAILPTPIVAQQMQQGGVAVVLTTEPIPHIAMSAAPGLDAATRDAVRKALVDANKTPDGRAMLEKIGFPRFDPATRAIYAGQSRVLREYWGY